MKKASIVLLNWNYRNYLKDCLDSIFNQSYENYEVLFVDNGSVDGSVKFVRKNYPKAVIIENKKNLGWTGGNNVGIKKSKGDFIVLVNIDIKADKDWLKELIITAESDKKIGIVGGKIYKLDDPKRLWEAGGKFNFFTGAVKHIGENDFDREGYNIMRDVDYVSGCNFLIRKELVEKIGLIDDDYFASYEDIDYCYKAKRNGYRVVYSPKSKLWHKGRASDERIPAMRTYLDFRNRIIFMKKNAKKIFWLTFPFFYLFDLLIFAIIRLFKRNFSGISAALIGSFHGLIFPKKRALPSFD